MGGGTPRPWVGRDRKSKRPKTSAEHTRDSITRRSRAVVWPPVGREIAGVAGAEFLSIAASHAGGVSPVRTAEVEVTGALRYSYRAAVVYTPLVTFRICQPFDDQIQRGAGVQTASRNGHNLQNTTDKTQAIKRRFSAR